MIKKYYKYFTQEELECHGEDCCDHTMMIDNDFMTAMMHLRFETGGKLYVHSAFRCNKHNKEVGGVDSSWHTKAQAMDCVPEFLTLDELATLAEQYFEEVIVYANHGFVHIAHLKNPYDSNF